MARPSRAELEAIENQQVAWAALMGAEVVEDASLGATLIRYPDTGPGLNLGVRIRWPGDEISERLAEVENRVKAAGRWPAVIVSEGLTEPADLESALAGIGWLRLDAERIMFTRHAPVVPHLDRSLRVEAVTPASAIECARLEAEVFGQPRETTDSRAEYLATAVADGQTRGFLLRLAGEVVASARLAPGPRVAGLHGIGVAARHRRRGYGRMITAIATRAGLATGHGLVWLSVGEANTAAIDLYRSLGYERSFTRTRWAAPSR